MATNKKIKAPALLCDKIGKYECFTGEETLPSGSSHIILQAEFTYSFLWKSFQKQKKQKTSEVHGEKKAEKQREKKLASPNLYASKKDSLLFLIQKEVFNELYYEIFDGIDKLNKEIDYDN